MKIDKILDADVEWLVNHTDQGDKGSAVRIDDFPPAGIVDKALAMVDYAGARAAQKAARDEGRLVGIGLSTYGEICAFGPSPATPAGGWESATVNVEVEAGRSSTVKTAAGSRPSRAEASQTRI